MHPRRNLALTLSGVAAALLAAAPADAAQITYREGVNNYSHLGSQIWSGSIGNFGGDDQMLAGAASFLTPDGPMRPVLAFDLTGIPDGSVITSVSLQLTTDPNEAGTGTIGDLNLHAVNGPATMIEGTGSGGNEAEGVTWNRPRAGVAWNNEGGDFSPTVLASIPAFETNLTDEVKTFASSNDFVAAAQSALDGDAPLELLINSPGTDPTASNWVRFASDDHATEAARPLLTVTYEIPEPTALASLLAGSGLLVLGRRRPAG